MPTETSTSSDLELQDFEHEDRTDRFDLRALYETSRLLSASLDLDFVLENLLLTAMSKLFVTRGAVLFYEPLEDACRIVAVKGKVGLQKGEYLSLEQKPGVEILRGDSVPPPLAEHDLKLVLPLVHGHRKIGWLALGSKATGRAFTASEMEFIRSLVNMSSSAVHNALLVEELKQANRDLDAKVQALNTLFDLSQEFNATVDRERLVKLLSFALMGQMTVHKYLFLLRPADSEDERDARVAAAKGISKSVLETEQMVALCRTEKLVRLEDAPEGPPVWDLLREHGFSLVLPIRHRGETCAVLCLGPKLTEAPYEPGDIEFLYSLGNLAFVSIQNSHLVEEQIEKRQLEKEISLARDIQQRLLPRTLPQVPGVELAGRATPSRQVGGDYYDIIQIGGDRLLLAIADVTGKGVPAALLMANLQACLHTLHPIDMTLEEATARINRVICDNTDAAKFITFFHGIYHPDEGKIDYVNAGHNPPCVVRADGELERLEAGGLLLGVMSSATYERGIIQLAPGDLFVSFTDGVTEAMNPEEEEYGEERLIACLREHRHQSAQEVLEAVHADVQDFAGRPEFMSDDLTMIVLKRAAA